jgi:hypothetical protein
MDTRNASKKWFTREKKWIFSDEYDINLAEWTKPGKWLATFKMLTSKLHGSNKYDLKIYSNEFPDSIYILTIAANDHKNAKLVATNGTIDSEEILIFIICSLFYSSSVCFSSVFFFIQLQWWEIHVSHFSSSYVNPPEIIWFKSIHNKMSIIPNEQCVSIDVDHYQFPERSWKSSALPITAIEIILYIEEI